MLRDALTYPLRGPDPESVYLPGLVLSFATALAVEFPLPFAFAAAGPAALLVGYLGEVYEAGIEGADTPPPFRTLRSAAVRGVALSGLAALYLLPAVAALAVTVAGTTAGTVPGSLSTAASLRVTAGATALLVLVIGAAYAVPAAAGCALAAGTVRAGLSPGAVAARATEGAYFTAFWAGVVVVAGALAVGSALAGALGRVGAAVGVVLTFHALVSAAYLVGRGFGETGTLYDLL